jgi:hypothetical protein
MTSTAVRRCRAGRALSASRLRSVSRHQASVAGDSDGHAGEDPGETGIGRWFPSHLLCHPSTYSEDMR